MYSNRHRFIWARVPKTGSTSIAAALRTLTRDECRSVDGKHHLPVLEHIPCLDAPLDQYFVFTFVRNPWDRMVSGYFSRREIRNQEIGHAVDFSEYCRRSPLRHQYNNSKQHGEPVAYDFVGRFESLQADFDAVCDRLGFKRMPLPYRNASKHANYREYYTAETRDLIARNYARDIDLFGYRF